MRLIDADDFKVFLQSLVDAGAEYSGVIEQLDKQPKVYDVDKVVELPVGIGDAVYVLSECKDIPAQLDGTFYDTDGGFGTATGYYCPYENYCPFNDNDFDSCVAYENRTAVFEDSVSQIIITCSNEFVICTELTNVSGELGKYIFLTRSEAEQALSIMNGENDG